MKTEEISIKANDLAIEMTVINIKSKDLAEPGLIEKELINNNAAVRKMIASRGINLEKLPIND